MLRLEVRPQPSPFWGYASPLLALLITVLIGIALFEVLGKDPVRGLQVFFWEPIKSGYAISELLVKATPLLIIALAAAPVTAQSRRAKQKSPAKGSAPPPVAIVNNPSPEYRSGEVSVAVRGTCHAVGVQAAGLLAAVEAHVVAGFGAHDDITGVAKHDRLGRRPSLDGVEARQTLGAEEPPGVRVKAAGCALEIATAKQRCADREVCPFVPQWTALHQ